MNSTKIDFTGAYRKYSSNKKYGDRLLIDSSCIAQLRNEMNILKKKYVNKSTTLNIKDDVEQFLNQTYKEYLNNINFIEEKSNLKGILNDIENY